MILPSLAPLPPEDFKGVISLIWWLCQKEKKGRKEERKIEMCFHSHLYRIPCVPVARLFFPSNGLFWFLGGAPLSYLFLFLCLFHRRSHPCLYSLEPVLTGFWLISLPYLTMWLGKDARYVNTWAGMVTQLRTSHLQSSPTVTRAVTSPLASHMLHDL